MTGFDESEIDEDLEGLALCPCCLAPIYNDANFCGKCGAPQGFIASAAPFYSVLAEGYIYRTATCSPTRMITVCGIWLIFGIYILMGLFGTYLEINDYLRLGSFQSFYLLCLYGGWALIGIFGIVRCTRNYIRHRNEKNNLATEEQVDP